MKKKLLFLLLGCMTFRPLLSEATPFADMGMRMGAGQSGGLLPMPTEAEMEEINKFLATLSDKELEELAKIGEEIIATAEKEGVPLFFDAPETTQKPAPPPAQPPKEVVQPEQKPSHIKRPSQDVRSILSRLITVLDAIRQKASSDNELEDSLTPLDQQLNSLLYYLHVTNEETIAGYLKEKEFEKLYDMLKLLEVDLTSLNQRFTVPEKLTSKREFDKRTMEQARRTLENIIVLLQRAFFEQGINGEFEKLLKKYEPEALKVKKELEGKERQAHEAVKRIPVINQPKVPAPQRGYTGPGGPQLGAHPHGYQPSPFAAGGARPGTQPTSISQQKQDPKATTSNKPAKPATQNKPPLTMSDLEKGIEEQFDKIESSLASKRGQLSNFLANYPANKNESDTVSSSLGEANFALKRLKKTVAKWHELAEKEAKNGKEFQDKTKHMHDLFQSARHNSVKALHEQVKNLSGKKVPLEGSVKKFKEFMDDIEKKLTGQV